jgi:hypothetical protein
MHVRFLVWEGWGAQGQRDNDSFKEGGVPTRRCALSVWGMKCPAINLNADRGPASEVVGYKSTIISGHVSAIYLCRDFSGFVLKY